MTAAIIIGLSAAALYLVRRASLSPNSRG